MIAPIEPVGPTPSASLLALNQADATHLSDLDPAGLARLSGMAFMAARIGEADALLIAFDQDAAYASPNFLWFRQRYPRFVYVDRVVVAGQARGRGLARRLYEALFARAEAAGHERVVCEVNAEPPNPGSDAFHAALGFEPVGDGTPSAGKRVRYLLRPLRPEPAR
ncbi:GNAT family N-acetyltransferase [Acetobacteraceae bacterium KSS8]|uniref:GNAT family N-acetyltransferase n=1 Tax=Endosaccharibacter trunci TaxID=2812733 RepID=A0ABT1W9E0_9PROT|nr:GNAT family N-acetyltransferase [Acetobacteraceae bacterium KSS8]